MSYNNRYTKAAYERLVRSVEAPEKVPAKDRFRGVSEKYCCDELMGQATAIAEPLGRKYNTLSLTIRFSRDMELMSSLQHLIQRNLSEANCALLAKTAGTLSKALRDGDAEFILEKAGIRYHHVLMDEFQDTSRLQWSVIRRLLMDVLAGAGNTLLIAVISTAVGCVIGLGVGIVQTIPVSKKDNPAKRFVVRFFQVLLRSRP